MKHFDKILFIVMFCLFGCANKEFTLIQLDCPGGKLEVHNEGKTEVTVCTQLDGTKTEKFAMYGRICEAVHEVGGHVIYDKCIDEETGKVMNEQHNTEWRRSDGTDLTYTNHEFASWSGITTDLKMVNGIETFREETDATGRVRLHMEVVGSVKTERRYASDGTEFTPCVYDPNLPSMNCSYIEMTNGSEQRIRVENSPLGSLVVREDQGENLPLFTQESLRFGKNIIVGRTLKADEVTHAVVLVLLNGQYRVLIQG